MINPYKAHPWHGVSAGENIPEQVTVFVEIVSSDTVKYEIDKESGFLKIDRPQKYSNTIPSLYGFIPRTYSGSRVAEFARAQGATAVVRGDADPLDICVLTSHHIPHGNILLQAIPIGGLCLIDKGEADDKIIAVMVDDPLYRQYSDIGQLPEAITDRLKHYFLTYKNLPGEPLTVQITEVYDRAAAHQVILHSVMDYQDLCASSEQ
jgi:inorganic pyrophosphatase